jgi:glycosyltransferase involved in cell wall biosynthesis
MPMPKVQCSQTVYLHQSLQFAPVKFSFLKKEERTCAIRQRIICQLIRKNLRRADEVIVQTRWMKKNTAQWTGIPESRIHVESPRLLEYEAQIEKSAIRNPRKFFYPANGHIYKNHRIIIEACKLLKRDGIYDYHISFTLNPSDNGFVKSLYDEVRKEQLPISFIGYQDQDAVFTKYAEQTLLFPSYIETFGLPLQEAKAFIAPIIASDCPYAHDVLEGYDHCRFARWDDAQAWADAIKKELNYGKHSSLKTVMKEMFLKQLLGR